MRNQVIQDFKVHAEKLQPYLSDANMTTLQNWLSGGDVRADVLRAILRQASRIALEETQRAKHASQLAAELALWIEDEDNE